MAVHAAHVRRRTLLVAAAALGLGLAVIGPESPAASVSQLPHGWRWESFGGVQVGIPGGWGWGNGAQRVNQWCVNPYGDRTTPPIVGRPWIQTLADCGSETPESPRPETLLKNTGQIVAFQHTTPQLDGGVPGDTTSAEGDSLLMRRRGVDVVVIAEPALRRQIAATVHTVDADVNGCPTTDPVSLDPSRRPAAVSSVQSLGEVRSVSICQYMLGRLPTRRPPATPAPTSEPEPTTDGAPTPRLLASAILSGALAQEAVMGSEKGPVGSGPNNPKSCSEEVQYGDDVIVLRVQHVRGESQIYLRFSGCNYHGFDDGTTVHRLTSATVANFLVAGVVINSYTSEQADDFKLR